MRARTLKRAAIVGSRVIRVNLRLVGGGWAHGNRSVFIPVTCVPLPDVIVLSAHGFLSIGRKPRARGRFNLDNQDKDEPQTKEKVPFNSGCRTNRLYEAEIEKSHEYVSNAMTHDNGQGFRSPDDTKSGSFFFGEASSEDNRKFSTRAILRRDAHLGDDLVIAKKRILERRYLNDSLMIQRGNSDIRLPHSNRNSDE
ncbi:hypothetical protein [Adlercreutzia sp. ZJ242]|uniref:hypothetical protein n=1 Tax=Adlercreutzia sp. ZJ242 TaxID=2709409 RepID=UPI001980053B|nr:hypothetical protein [Adlercreutzia sp. ZJ242]